MNWRGVIVSSTSIWATATLRMVSTRLQRVQRRAACRPSSSSSWSVAELVQQQLEPELEDLVDDDEQHLVVLRRIGARPLGTRAGREELR